MRIHALESRPRRATARSLNGAAESGGAPLSPRAPRSTAGQIVQLGMLFSGAILLGLIIWQADPINLWDRIAALGSAILLFIAVDGISDGFHALATRYCFKPEYRHVSFIELFCIRLTARAYNFLTPTSDLGGEFVKATLLRRYAPVHEAVSVVIIDKFTFGFTQFVMAFCGSAYIVMHLDISADAKIAFWAASAALALGFAGFLVLQRRGGFVAAMERVTHAVGGRRLAGWMAHHLRPVDSRLQSYYRTQGTDVLLSMFWQAVGSAVDVVVAWMFLKFASGTSDWTKAIAIWSLGKWFDTVAFMVPAGLGTQELSRAVLFRAISYPWQEGVVFAMVLRINQIFWSLVGLAVHALVLARDSAAETASP